VPGAYLAGAAGSDGSSLREEGRSQDREDGGTSHVCGLGMTTGGGREVGWMETGR